MKIIASQWEVSSGWEGGPAPARSRMKLTVITLLLILSLLSGALASAQTPSDQDDVIRVETDLTNLFFTATDKQKGFITTLREEDLRLSEDGVPQKILTFQRETDRPLSLAFLIDVSASEERTLPQEKAAARSFIETIIQSKKDQAAIIPFTGSAFLEQGLTRDVFSIYRALERVEVALPSYLGSGRPISGIASGPGMKAPPPEGTTAIWDAIALTASEVLAQDQTQKGQGQTRQSKTTRDHPPDGWAGIQAAVCREAKRSIERSKRKRSSTRLASATASMKELIATRLTR